MANQDSIDRLLGSFRFNADTSALDEWFEEELQSTPIPEKTETPLFHLKAWSLFVSLASAFLLVVLYAIPRHAKQGAGISEGHPSNTAHEKSESPKDKIAIVDAGAQSPMALTSVMPLNVQGWTQDPWANLSIETVYETEEKIIVVAHFYSGDNRQIQVQDDGYDVEEAFPGSEGQRTPLFKVMDTVSISNISKPIETVLIGDRMEGLEFDRYVANASELGLETETANKMFSRQPIEGQQIVDSAAILGEHGLAGGNGFVEEVYRGPENWFVVCRAGKSDQMDAKEIPVEDSLVKSMFQSDLPKLPLKFILLGGEEQIGMNLSGDCDPIKEGREAETLWNLRRFPCLYRNETEFSVSLNAKIPKGQSFDVLEVFDMGTEIWLLAGTQDEPLPLTKLKNLSEKQLEESWAIARFQSVSRPLKCFVEGSILLEGSDVFPAEEKPKDWQEKTRFGRPLKLTDMTAPMIDEESDQKRE